MKSQDQKTLEDFKDAKLDIQILLGHFKKALSRYGKGEFITQIHVANLSSVRAEIMDSLAFISDKDLDEIYKAMKDERN